jgi:hypothetical protein
MRKLPRDQNRGTIQLPQAPVAHVRFDVVRVRALLPARYSKHARQANVELRRLLDPATLGSNPRARTNVDAVAKWEGCGAQNREERVRLVS